jgi:uncharacterized protein YdcH (DUF465 family)
MDPRDIYPRPPPTGETLSTHGLLHWIFEKHYELARDVAALLANQQTNKADIIEHLKSHRIHHDQRLDDFKDEIVPRLERWEARIEEVHDKLMSGPSRPEAESSLAKSLFGSLGVFLWGVIPWKHLGLMLPGILLAISSNLFPESTRKVILAAIEVFWKTPPP